MATVEQVYEAEVTGLGGTITSPSITVGAGEALLAFVAMRDGGATITDVDWNTSEAFTKEVDDGTVLYNSAWSLLSPTATTATVVATISSSRDRPKKLVVVRLSDVDGSDLVEASSFAVEDGLPYATTLNDSLTTLTNNAEVLSFVVAVRDSSGNSLTNDTGTQQVNDTVTGTFSGLFGLNNITKATAGSQTMQWTQSVANQWSLVLVAVKDGGGGGASAPDAFTSGQWSVSDLQTNGDIRINISTLPADGGDSITDLEYQLDTGTWTSLGGTTTGNYDISGLTDGTSYDVKVRAVNSTGNGADSDTKSVTPTGVPDAFTSGQWSVADLGTGGDARITITTLPAANGSAITDLEYQLDAGSWTSLAGTTTGTYDIAGLTDGVSTDVKIRAVNGVGNGGDSDTKSVTTTAGATITPPTVTMADEVYTLDKDDTGSSAAGEYESHTLKDIETKTTTIDSAATITPNADRENLLAITAIGEDFTLANPSGTPANGQRLVIRILDDGTSRSITYGAAYRAIGVTLPSATTISKTLYLECYYNSADSKWDVVTVAEEA